MTCRTGQRELSHLHQTYEALLAEGMVTLEDLRFDVGALADETGEESFTDFSLEC